MFGLNSLPEIIILTETWFKIETIQNIDGYTSYHTVRDLGRSGGVSIFVKNSIESTQIDELCISNSTIEICTIKFKINNVTDILYAIYRPHSDTIDNFILSLNEILDRNINGNFNDKILLGDLNIDLGRNCPLVENFINFMHTYHFFPLITNPTRYPPQNNSPPSILDHIWITNPIHISSGIIMSDLTDHLPTFLRLSFETGSHSDNEKLKTSFRLINPSNKQKFNSMLREVNWDSIMSGNVDEYAQNFIQLLNSIYCKCFPLKIKFTNNKRNDAPWLNSNLLKLIKSKSQYFHLFKIGVVSRAENNAFKNKVKLIIKKAKLNFYRNLFQKYKNNLKKTWDTMKSLISNKIENNSIKSIVATNGLEYSNDADISEILNNYFCHVATNLESSLPHSSIDPLDFVKPNNLSSLLLTRVASLECNTIINSLKLSKQNINTIPVVLFKEYQHHFIRIICNIVNLGFSTGSFPNCLKQAVVTPIFKKGDRKKCENYRPISVLPSMSKIFERCLHNRIYNFVCDFSIINDSQNGFMKGRSTENAIIDLTEIIYKTLDSKQYSINIFIDFRKAFDTIDHHILLRKLDRYGIRGLSLQLIRSFLTNRYQSVKIKQHVSSAKQISIGVPQGSILAPLLFLLYVNDLPNISPNCSTILFADDTTLSLHDESTSCLELNCNEILNKLYNWTLSNRISVNIDKTFYIPISNRSWIVSPHITLNNQIIDSRSNGNFLGVVLDDKIKFNLHINSVCSKISKQIGILYRIKNYLPIPCLIQLYYSYIFPYLNYCNLVWGNTYESHLNPLIILQKRAIRVITKSEYLAHTNDLFSRNRILKLPDIHKLKLGIYTFKNELFSQYTRSHSYNTRNRTQLLPEFHRLSSTQRSISYSAPSFWNEIPAYIRESLSLSTFKIRLKQCLIDEYCTDHL